MSRRGYLGLKDLRRSGPFWLIDLGSTRLNAEEEGRGGAGPGHDQDRLGAARDRQPWATILRVGVGRPQMMPINVALQLAGVIIAAQKGRQYP